MSHLLYLMFRCDFDVIEILEFLWDLNTPEEREENISPSPEKQWAAQSEVQGSRPPRKRK